MFPFPWDFPDVFSQEFRDTVDEAARRQLTPLKDDPNLIGWFIGNEPQVGAQLWVTGALA